MAWRTKDIPEDAVVLNEAEAISYVWDLVTDWKPPTETWALRYGASILGGLNAFSGILINNHFRRKLKLGPYGFFASAIPITVMPGIVTILFHRHLIATDILLKKKPACPICYELRGAFIQLGLGLVYPMVLAPNAALMLANRYYTARTPHLNEGVKVMFNYLRKITQPFNATLVALTTAQVIASSIIVYFEINNHLKMQKKIQEIEEIIMSEEMGRKNSV